VKIAVRVLITAVLAVSVAGCASTAKPTWESGSTPAVSASAASSSPSAKPDPSVTKPSATPPGPSLITSARLNAAKKLIGSKPGVLGIIVYDRATGTAYREGTTTHLTWTASTIKLAIVTELLEKQRAGSIQLSATDRSDIADILNWSSDDAATELWHKYGNDALVPRMTATYGMKTLTFIDGFKRFWGHMKCTPEDLMHLIKYVMTKLNPADRSYIVNAMQHVGSIQQWGVWAAGADLHPGTKDGWSIEPDNGSKHWVTNAVGFAGPGQRYLVALMYELPPSLEIGDGVHAVSDLVATVFGATVPAKVTVPDPSTGL
jgi:hypothetical protein